MRMFILCGLPKKLRMDRDPRFVWSWTTDSFPAPLIRFLRVVGVEEDICPPRRPDRKAYVERCIRTLKEECLDRFSLNSIADCYEALEAFPHYHNSQHRHYGRACNGKTPDDAFPTLPTLPQLPELVDTHKWLRPDHGRVFRRNVTSNGTIQVNKQTLYIGNHLHRQQVLVHLDADKCLLHVSHAGQKIKKFKIDGISDEPVELQTYFLQLQDEAVSIERYRRAVWQKVGDDLCLIHYKPYIGHFIACKNHVLRFCVAD